MLDVEVVRLDGATAGFGEKILVCIAGINSDQIAGAPAYRPCTDCLSSASGEN